MTIEQMTVDIRRQLAEQGKVVSRAAAHEMAAGILAFERTHPGFACHEGCGCISHEELLASLERRD